MSDPNDPPWWLCYILPPLLFFKDEIKKCYTKMKTWEKEKLKEFWGHAMAVIIGIVVIGLFSNIYSHNQVDFVAVFLGLFNNFEHAYVPAVVHSFFLGAWGLGAWLAFSNTKCCIKVIKTGDCV